MNLRPLLLVLAAVLAAPAATAKVGADKAALLGTTLTPVGAEEAGNKAGTIPAWKGGVPKLPAMFAGYQRGKGEYYPDPFPQDKPKFRIDAANARQYAAMLPAGAARRLELHPKLYYNVYPTRRTAT